MIYTGTMSELGIAEYFGIGETVATIAIFLITPYYSQREIRNLRVDVETKVLNYLNEKIHGMGDMMMIQNPQLIRILDRDFSERTPEMALAYYILYMCARMLSTCARERY